MGVQFWWFYDVIVVAVALVLIFITVKRGFMKATATAVGYILAVFISFSVSGGLADSIADTALKGSKIKDLTFTLAENDYAAELTAQINSLKYYAPADQRVIQDIYSTGENVDNNIYTYLSRLNNGLPDSEEEFYVKLHECYAASASKFIEKRLSPYSAECAAEQIKKQPQKYWQFLKLLCDDETKQPAAKYMIENYLKQPYSTYMRLIVYVVLFAIILLLTLFISTSVGRYDHTEKGFVTVSLSILIGLGKAAAVLLTIAVLIRLNVITGSDKMLFFNHEAIDSTYIFKYFYAIIKSW